MIRRLAPWMAAIVGCVTALVTVTLLRLPYPFPGFSAVAAAGVAFLGTFSLCYWMPASWIWSDTERLTHAFRVRHNVSDGRAASALQAIAAAHERADALRVTSKDFAPALKDRAVNAATRLDQAAREIFYEPERLTALRAIISRSELIADAVASHAKLRARADAKGTQVELSRAQVGAALDALEDAFSSSDLTAAEGLLAQVTASSATAETLLAPRRSRQ